jgi:hypothetical protein
MPSSRYQIVAQLDPRTMQPIQQPSTGVVQQTQQGGQQQQGGFNIDRFAAESAADQMNWAVQKGARLTMGDFENARQKAWDAAAQAQRESAMQKQRIQDELQSKVAMSQFEEGKVKRMSDAQIDTAASYASAADNIMKLYHMHQDANNVFGYGNPASGGAASKAYNLIDPRVRGFNAALEGSLTNVARGVMGDTGVQASEPSAQGSVRALLFNDGDNKAMGDVKAINLLQGVLTNMGDKIRGLNNNNISATSMQDDYTRIYNEYQKLVTGPNALSSQLEHPAASPNEVFGTPEAQKSYIAQGPQPLQPVVKAGLSQPSQDTINAVNSAASGQVPGVGGPAPPQAAGGVPSPEQVANLPYNMPQITPEEPRPQSMAPGLGTISGTPTDAGRSPAAPASTAGISWLQGLLPQDFQTHSEQYVGYGT